MSHLYNVYLRGEIELEITITANSLEDAIRNADEVNVHDLFSKKATWNDGDLVTVGILQH